MMSGDPERHRRKNPEMWSRWGARLVAAVLLIAACSGGNNPVVSDLGGTTPIAASTSTPTEPSTSRGPNAEPAVPVAASPASAASSTTIGPAGSTRAPRDQRSYPLVPGNNALGTGPLVFTNSAGLPAAFVESAPGDPPGPVLVECITIECSDLARTRPPGLAGVGGLPLLFADGPLALASFENDSLSLVICHDSTCSDSSTSAMEDGSPVEFGAFTRDGRPAFTYGVWSEDPIGEYRVLPMCSGGICDAVDSPTAWVYTGLVEWVNIRVEVCESSRCTTPSKSDLVPAGGDEGWIDTIAVAVGGDHMPVVAYGWMGEPRQLRVAHCENWTCTEYSDVAVADLHGGWAGPSLAIGSDGFPIMAYASNNQITVTKCEDPACMTTVTSTPLGDTPGNPSLAIGPDGLPIVGYYVVNEEPPDAGGPNDPEEWTQGEPALFHCADLTCSRPTT